MYQRASLRDGQTGVEGRSPQLLSLCLDPQPTLSVLCMDGHIGCSGQAEGVIADHRGPKPSGFEAVGGQWEGGRFPLLPTNLKA